LPLARWYCTDVTDAIRRLDAYIDAEAEAEAGA
jgi:hypothetical protein